MWPGLVGKGSPGAEPCIDLDTMLDLTAAAQVNGQKFDGVDLFLHDPHVSIDSTDDDLKKLANKIVNPTPPPHATALPAEPNFRAVALWGEAASIRALASADRFVAFAGLDLAVFQSGQYQAPRRRISKRGSPHLRRTLWTMASLAVRREGHLRTHYLHHRRHGLDPEARYVFHDFDVPGDTEHQGADLTVGWRIVIPERRTARLIRYRRRP